ncbi:unnamed protein product [Amoebophrya sp. A25]|nr:unnamed protein product [Amoebophrya sp. A25]|eukprot:GSA25T00012082001.1
MKSSTPPPYFSSELSNSTPEQDEHEYPIVISTSLFRNLRLIYSHEFQPVCKWRCFCGTTKLRFLIVFLRHLQGLMLIFEAEQTGSCRFLYAERTEIFKTQFAAKWIFHTEDFY